MTAYAAVSCLMQTLEMLLPFQQPKAAAKIYRYSKTSLSESRRRESLIMKSLIAYPPSLVIPFQRQQIAALYSQLTSLEAFLKNPPDPNIFNDDAPVLEQLETRIGHAAQKALDFVDCKIAGFKLEDFRKNPPDPDVSKDDAAVPKPSQIGTSLMPKQDIDFRDCKTTETQITPSNKATQIGLPHEDGKGKAVDVDALNGFESLYPQIEEMISINAEVKFISDKKNCEKVLVHPQRSLSIRRDDKYQHRGEVHPQTEISLLGQSSERSVNEEVNLVGFCKDVETMVDCLTNLPWQRKVFAVVGMAGIGKTTFARRVYNDPFVSHHFYIRSWITISQNYQVKELLLGLLNCLMKLTDELYEKSKEQLREQLYRSLKGQRYLIVLDDMWDIKAWLDLERCFPDDKNGSRIILTSRYREVAAYAASYLKQMPFLTTDESWELFCLKVFASRSCPPELVNLGRQIVRKCGGLPLAVVVVAGLLSKIGKTQEIWEKVAESVGSLLMEDPEHCCLNLVALSYHHLPNHLKACFLYIGIFPEDTEIPVWKLIWLWIAEGFIQPIELKCLEEVAEEYLKDLVARSLILVRTKRSDGGIKTCCIHDLMRDFCLREAQAPKNKLFHVITQKVQFSQADVSHLRRLTFHSNIHQYISSWPPIPLLHTFLCFDVLAFSHRKYSSIGFINFKLLKVLDIINLEFEVLPDEISLLVLLRYLAISVETCFPSVELARLLLLQTLIVDCMWDGYLPRIIWDMPGLRHLFLKKNRAVEFSQSLQWTYFYVPEKNLENLQTLSMVRPRYCTFEVFVRVPNLRKLGVFECEEDYQHMNWFNNLVHLHELQALKYIFANPFARPAKKPDRLPIWGAFPPNLKKLTLSGTSFPWEDMFTIGKLPNLEVLKLRNYAFSGTYWEQSEGGFCGLKFLLISSTNLEHWKASGNSFPRLQHLVLKYCRLLKEIPYGLAEAPYLEIIELHCCSDSVKRSAQRLQQQQQSLGNDELTIHTTER